MGLPPAAAMAAEAPVAVEIQRPEDQALKERWGARREKGRGGGEGGGGCCFSSG